MTILVPADAVTAQNDQRPLRVLAWPASAPSNRYTGTLYENMTGVVIDDFKPGWNALLCLLKRRYDVFHIHWLERAFWREGKLAIIRAVCITLLSAFIMKLRGGAIVWTAHDPVPHELEANQFARKGAFSLLWKTYTALLTRMLDGVILLSATHRPIVTRNWAYLENLPFAITPHPHYKGVYPNDLSREEARRRLDVPAEATALLLLGAIRPYKNVEALVESFRDLPGDDLRLLIAGRPDSSGYADMLKELARGDPRIIFHFTFIADDSLQLFLNAADAVVIPFRNATNSGSVALALSFARPVAVPDLPVFRELQNIVGEHWMRLIPGALSPCELTDVIRWLGQTRSSKPDLDVLDWSRHAAQAVAFFRSVLRRGASAQP